MVKNLQVKEHPRPMCVKKRRWADRDMSHIRLGHRAFQMFYEMNTSAKQPKSMEDFIMSQYYEAFVKFGRSCMTHEWLEPRKVYRMVN